MANKIIPKRSSVSGKVPATTDLDVGEIAVNLTDRIIYTKDAGGTVVQLGGSSGGADLPAGSVIYTGSNLAPTGYLKANGAQVSRTTYAALFSAIGTAFGAGNGSTTFNLPDLRGEFPRGWDDGRGVDSGRTLGSSQSGAIESHDHAVRYAGGAGSAEPIKLQYTYATQFGTTTAGSGMVQPAGGAETRPRNIALLACIKF